MGERKRHKSIRSEGEGVERFGILPVPRLRLPNEPEGMYPHLLHLFKPDTFRRNHELLNGCYYAVTSVDRRPKRTMDDLLYPMVQRNAEYLLESMEGIRRAPRFREGEPGTDAPPLRSLFDLHEWYLRYFSRSEPVRSIVPVASSHAADLPLFTALVKEGVRPEEVAMVVIDKHFDGVWNLDQTVKASFMNGLLQTGIGGIAIFGMPDSFVKEYTEGVTIGLMGNELDVASELRKRSKPGDLESYLASAMEIDWQIRSGANLDPLVPAFRELLEANAFASDPVALDFLGKYTTHVLVYEPNRDRLSMPSGYLSAFGQVNMDKAKKLLTEKLQQFKRQGVKHVLFCLDADGLDLEKEGITATAYSPWSKVLSYGIREYPGNVDMVSRLIAEAVLAENEIRRYAKSGNRMNITKEHIAELVAAGERKKREIALALSGPLNELTDFGKEWMRYGGQEHPYQVFEVPPGGFLADQALEFIRETSRVSRQLGMSFGIPHPRTGVVVKGTITEVEGPDRDGKTGRCVAQIAKALYEA